MADLSFSGSSDPVCIFNDTNGNQLTITSQGAAIVTQVDGFKASYSAAIVGLVTALTPTDIFTLTGSATKTIRVTRVIFSGTENTAAVRDILFIKRSAANSGGTSTAPTRIPYDSTNAAATATVLAYTANPSLGAAVGTILAVKVDVGATNLASAVDQLIISFGTSSMQAIVLRGTSEVFAVNLNSITSASGSFNVTIEWTEE